MEAVGVTEGLQEGEVEAMANPLMEVVVVMVVAEQEVMEAAQVAATMDKSFNQCYIAFANGFGVLMNGEDIYYLLFTFSAIYMNLGSAPVQW